MKLPEYSAIEKLAEKVFLLSEKAIQSNKKLQGLVYDPCYSETPITYGKEQIVELIQSFINTEMANSNKWISINSCCPLLSQKVLLCLNGIVQYETYIYDKWDNNDFWDRLDIDEVIPISTSDYWMPLPQFTP